MELKGPDGRVVWGRESFESWPMEGASATTLSPVNVYDKIIVVVHHEPEKDDAGR